MKILPCGVAVIEHDTHISKWVEESGTLRIAEPMLTPFREFIKPGGRILDVGANIGDHTATYSDWVGPTGYVFAFEPNQEAFECLSHNFMNSDNVYMTNCALSDVKGKTSLVRSDNVGASHLSGNSGSIQVRTLDEYRFHSVDFIKIDAEGFETKILRGGKETIESGKPVMLIEVNDGALVRAGSSRDELLKQITDLGYNFRITDRNLKATDLQYDVICVHGEGKQ